MLTATVELVTDAAAGDYAATRSADEADHRPSMTVNPGALGVRGNSGAFRNTKVLTARLAAGRYDSDAFPGSALESILDGPIS